VIAVFWKELRELASAGLLALIGAAAFGFALGAARHQTVALALMIMLSLIGFAVGVWQARLDRAASEDQFLRHRPMSSLRIHVARSVAGVAVAAAAAAVLFATMAYVAWRFSFDEFGRPLFDFDRPWWADFTVPRAAFAFVCATATWAVARIGASPRSSVARPLLALALPTLFGRLVARTPGVAVPGAITAAAGAAALVLAAANAVAFRSTGRRG